MTRAAFALAGALALGACQASPTDGPVDVKYDRDTCAGCSMVISEPHFAAEVRGGPKSELKKFDDVGCAVKWLEKQPWANDASTKLWVARYGEQPGTQWLDAKAARYVPGKGSPMGFGFGAVEGEQPGSLTFEAMREQVLNTGKKN